ncbi:hypothetical protein SPRG_00792 [Saprolegnia parasitica CBS 223.65]|uniref:Uncharacterized protein n=1 Tax=Saprolegnia parasitica (strain CBS 223.65) TaxID=695850 RepID=A0A067CZQ8_SAPPC|nr:hypothetical protein SPRG_00792 [Saprolegnia parasitica CBS 223.65]KDO34730.1 hypothetical protein SPRG_00792 [Saprolegnia parasitica CBS 223.65]|eukprot:XP_012194399.1 hypothetical protein SPRG_00792 [Saprolegnia parasitica CBS 223.65]
MPPDEVKVLRIWLPQVCVSVCGALLVHPGYSVAFALTLVINCMALPLWMRLGHWQRSRRWGAIVIDVIASFLLGARSPRVSGRYMAITSGADFVVHTILNAAFWAALQTLAIAGSS